MNYNKLKKILAYNFDWINEDDISETANLREELSLDSISLVKFQILVEDEFNIQFNPTQDDLNSLFESLVTLNEFIIKYENS